MSIEVASISQFGRTEPFELQVSRGQIPNHQVVQFGGFNPDIDTTWETICPDGNFTFQSVATVMKISSSSTNDAAVGIGARTVLITGLDANYNVISETVTLNGQTAVNTVNSYLRINGFTVTTAGNSLTAAGTIYAGAGVVTAGVPATVYELIPLGWNSRQSATYTIPTGYTGYISYSRLTFGQSAGTQSSWGRVTLTGTNGIKLTIVSTVSVNGMIQFTPKYPTVVQEKTLIMAEAMGIATNNLVSTIIQIVLVKNP